MASEDFYGDGEGEGGGGEGEGEGGMEEIMFEDDRVAQSSSRAMREPLSELGVNDACRGERVKL